jgi:hypothetical protein
MTSSRVPERLQAFKSVPHFFGQKSSRDFTGASIAYTRLGTPDIGLVSFAEVCETVATIRERIALAILVDADSGYGNALNVQRTVRHFERAGASAIQLEDQTAPKRCGHLDGKQLIGIGEMVGKIQAALDAWDSGHTHYRPYGSGRRRPLRSNVGTWRSVRRRRPGCPFY